MAGNFNIGKSTVCEIVKNRADIMSKITNGDYNPKRCRDRSTTLDDVDAALLQWFRCLRANSIHGIQGGDLLEKAKEFAESLGHHGTEISMSWINRWKDRHMICSLKVCGEGADVTPQQLTEWNEVQLPIILQSYSPENIFNADEFGLFWRLMPDRTLAFKGEKCIGGKSSKERVTVLLCANMSGTEKLPLWVVGKFKTPRCFRGTTYLPVTWRWNSKAWMTSALFREFVLMFNEKMRLARRHAALVIDNCPAHPKMETLSNAIIFHLPPNTTSHSQPLDAGVIHNLKTLFRRRLIRKRLVAFESKSPFSLSLLDALHIIKDSWDSVSNETIVNCFRSTGFRDLPLATVAEQPLTENEGDRNIWDMLRNAGFISADVQFSDYVNADDELVVAANPTESEIVQQLRVSGADEEESDEEDNRDPILESLTTSEGLQMLTRLRRLLEGMKDGPTSADFQAITCLERTLETSAIKKLQQKKITDFFL